MKRKKITLKCEHCGLVYSRYKVKDRPQKFCSRRCYLSSDYNREQQRRRLTGLKGDKNFNWIGGKIKYKSLHKWVNDQLGKAKDKECQNCHGKNGSKTMNWSNIDHKYTRDLKKWVPLCKICHSEYDQKYFKSYSNPKSLIISIWTK